MNELLKNIHSSVINGDSKDTEASVLAALDAGIDPIKILNEAMIEAMNEVGRLFEEGEYFVPEMLVSARSMQCGLAIIKPKLVQSDFKPLGTVVIGTVKGDLHDIGKNLVSMMLEGASFEIVDLGTDVAPEQFVEAVKSSGADIIAMSALLTTTIPNMQATINALSDAGLRDKVKVMVGGAPMTDQYAKEIGADGFSPDASRAVTVARNLVNAG